MDAVYIRNGLGKTSNIPAFHTTILKPSLAIRFLSFKNFIYILKLRSII